MKYIESLQNTLIKQLRLLQNKASERKSKELFVIEGRREVNMAIKGGYHFVECLICEGFEQENEQIAQKCETCTTIVSKEVYQKLTYRSKSEGILAVAKTKTHTLDVIPKMGKTGIILVVESPEKPGNIGAILRTIDASGISGVIIANPRTDLYNSNIIRSSLGCIFTINIATATTEQTIDFLKDRQIRIYATYIGSSSKPYYDCNFMKHPCAIVLGEESKGLSRTWIEITTDHIIIPMSGAVDSMNLSVSAGILVFEAKRQCDKL